MSSPRDSRKQISQAFAGAGAGLDQQMIAIIKGVSHCAQHVNLWLTVLVAGKDLFQRTAWQQDRGQQIHVQRLRLLRRRQLLVEPRTAIDFGVEQRSQRA